MLRGNQTGLSRAGIAKWVREGRLHPKYRGVYAYGHPKLSREGEWFAAVFAAGERAGLASLSAAFLHRALRYQPRGLCVEVDGEGHERPRTKADDRIRDTALTASGITVIRVGEAELQRPHDLLAKLAAQQLPGSTAR